MKQCIVCQHQSLITINKRLLSGENMSEMAKELGIPYGSLQNHSQYHLPAALVKSFEKSETNYSLQLRERLDDIIYKCEQIFNRNYEAKKDLTALKAIDSYRSTIQLLVNISSQLVAKEKLELETKKLELKEREQAGNKEFYESLNFLSLEEHQLFMRLINKASHHSSDVIVKDGRIYSYRSNKTEE